MGDTRKTREASPAANEGGTSPAFTLTKDELYELMSRAAREALSQGAPAPVLVDKQDLARQLGCSASHIDHLRKRGMPSVPVGRVVRFEPAAVVEWLRREEAQHG